MTTDEKIKARLEYLRGEIEAERISQGEISELQDLAEFIDPTDVVLLEWAGVPEFPIKYTVTVDVPVLVTVEARSEKEAEKLGDAVVARAYERMEASLVGSPDTVWLGARYDDTQVDEE
jgi:hypothetical protein